MEENLELLIFIIGLIMMMPPFLIIWMIDRELKKDKAKDLEDSKCIEK